jgi:hypothetical protein
MVNYSEGKIYRIQPKRGIIDGDVYIGHTCRPDLNQRWNEHIKSYKRKVKYGCASSTTTACKLFSKYGINGLEIVLIDRVNGKSLEEVISREMFHIRNTNCVNSNIRKL